MFEIVRVPLPVLRNVTDLGGLETPIACPP